MSVERLRASVALEMPAPEAERLLPAFIDDVRNGAAAARLPVGIPLEQFGLPGGLELVRNVDVSIARRRDEENLNDEFGVTWFADDSSLFPRFDGRLIVCAESGSKSFIELDGKYVPPFGDAGDVFDAAVGHAIAQTTARTFLDQVRDGLYRLARNAPLARSEG